MAGKWTEPRTLTRGPLAGQTFTTQADYAAAMRAYKTDNPDGADVSAGGDSSPVARVSGRSRAGGNGVTRDMALGLVATVNMVFAMLPPTRDDALDETEQTALANSIVDTARANKAFANIVRKICSAQSSASLGICVSAIVIKRVAKRGLLGEQSMIAGVGAEMILMGLAQGMTPAAPAPEPTSNGHSVETIPPILIATAGDVETR